MKVSESLTHQKLRCRIFTQSFGTFFLIFLLFGFPFPESDTFTASWTVFTGHFAGNKLLSTDSTHLNYSHFYMLFLVNEVVDFVSDCLTYSQYFSRGAKHEKWSKDWNCLILSQKVPKHRFFPFHFLTELRATNEIWAKNTPKYWFLQITNGMC